MPRSSNKKPIYEGKAKILYKGPEPNTLIQYFKDDATAFNAEKKATIAGKGVINNRISEFLMKRLNDMGISTTYIKTLNMREQLIKEVEIIPLEVVVRNIAAGSLLKKCNLIEGDRLSRPLIEFYYKDDNLGDPMLSEEHIINFDLASNEELDIMRLLAMRTNDFLSGIFTASKIKLVDFKLEFGRYNVNEDTVQILLADEISPDNCRLWDSSTNKKLDKDCFRHDLGDLMESYQEVARRLGLLKDIKETLEKD